MRLFIRLSHNDAHGARHSRISSSALREWFVYSIMIKEWGGLLPYLVHICVWRRSRQGQCDIGEIIGRVIGSHAHVPLNHPLFNGLPLTLSHMPGSVVSTIHQVITSPSRDSLIQNITPSIFVIFASLNHLSSDVSDGYSRVILQLWPLDFEPVVFTVAPRREGIYL